MKLLKRLTNKGQSILGTVVAVVVGAVAIVIGAIIMAELFDSITFTDYSADAEAALNTTQDMTWTAFTILPIAILVLAAVAVIAAVLILAVRRV